jgi:hypothetical protein
MIKINSVYMSTDDEKIKNKQIAFLHTLYSKSRIDRDKRNTIYSIGEELDLTAEETEAIVESLINKGWIKENNKPMIQAAPQLPSLTSDGLKEVQKSPAS